MTSTDRRRFLTSAVLGTSAVAGRMNVYGPGVEASLLHRAALAAVNGGTADMVGPLDRLIQVLDHLQVGVAATTRLLGVAEVPEDRTPGDVLPDAADVEGHDAAAKAAILATIDRDPKRWATRVAAFGSGWHRVRISGA